jgi:redox-sensitive bicupin YhaK (pirin superfamily)
MNSSEVEPHGGAQREEEGIVMQQLEQTEGEAVFVENASLIRMMGIHVLEALPSRGARYEQVDPFILLHEARFRVSDLEGVDTKHPHRGFDKVWYVIEGSASTSHSTGSEGAIERRRLAAGRPWC